MKVGDIVILKSGGPQMTVSFIQRRPDNFPIKDIREQLIIDTIEEYTICKWWDGEKFQSERFGLDAVEVVPIAVHQAG